MKKIKQIGILCIALIMLTIQSCSDRAQANVETLVSSDCGKNWKLIEIGQSIPRSMYACDMRTTLPSAPMTGSSHFETTFKNSVKAAIDLDYEYEIENSLQFITQAPYLAKSNVDADDVSGNNARFESAENAIIDKRIKDNARDLLGNIDIVEFDQSDFEEKLLEKVNAQLKTLGVSLNFLSFVPTPSEQTAQAIDVAQAMKIYDSKGLSDIGKQVMASRAGATKINVNPQAAQ